MAMAMVVTVMLVWSWAMMCEEWYVDIFSPDQNLGNFGRCHTIIYRCAAFWHHIYFPHKGSLDVLHPNRFQQSISLSRSNNGRWVEICVLIDCLHPCLHPGCTVVSRDNMHPWYAPLICTPGEERPPEDPRSQRDRLKQKCTGVHNGMRVHMGSPHWLVSCII